MKIEEALLQEIVHIIPKHIRLMKLCDNYKLSLLLEKIKEIKVQYKMKMYNFLKALSFTVIYKFIRR